VNFYIFSIISLLILGCGSPPKKDTLRLLKTDELVGTWLPTAQTIKYFNELSLNNQGTILLSEGNVCSVSTYLPVNDQNVPFVSGNGKWHLKHDTYGTGNKKEKNVVEVQIEGDSFSVRYFSIMENDGELFLWSYLGDPDSYKLLVYGRATDH
jgi:hypothetical protein